jgi:hypothetical protein
MSPPIRHAVNSLGWLVQRYSDNWGWRAWLKRKAPAARLRIYEALT